MEYRVFEGADHYYRTALDELEETISGYLAQRVEEQAAARALRTDKKRRQLQRD